MTEPQPSRGDNLVSVFRAPDEYVANIVRGLLVCEDIPAILESLQVPMYDGIMRVNEGYWGDVVVPEEYAQRSREIIEAYQSDNAEEK